jgi:hypothetical protein
MRQQVRVRLQEWDPFAGRTVAQVEEPLGIELEYEKTAARHVGDAVAGAGADQDQVTRLERDGLLLLGQLALAPLQKEQFQAFVIVKHDTAWFVGSGLVDEDCQVPRCSGRIRPCLMETFHGETFRGLSFSDEAAPPAASIPATEP